MCQLYLCVVLFEWKGGTQEYVQLGTVGDREQWGSILKAVEKVGFVQKDVQKI